MSQVDIFVYFPLLVWFILLFSFFYYYIYSFVLSFFYHVLKLRQVFYFTLLNCTYVIVLFPSFFYNIYKNFYISILKNTYIFSNNLVNQLKNLFTFLCLPL